VVVVSTWDICPPSVDPDRRQSRRPPTFVQTIPEVLCIPE
jgi:hypothetical protein